MILCRVEAGHYRWGRWEAFRVSSHCWALSHDRTVLGYHPTLAAAQAEVMTQHRAVMAKGATRARQRHRREARKVIREFTRKVQAEQIQTDPSIRAVLRTASATRSAK